MTVNVDFMRTLEEEYRQVSGLKNRSQYKIFYGQVFPAPILTLGLNPGGSPEKTSEDGTRQNDGSLASSSSSYFENMENDILDCEWRENFGLRRLLLPLVGDDRNRFRTEIVKTNLAFRRSQAVGDIDFAAAAREAVPFIEAIIDRVNPNLVVLTGTKIDLFLTLYARDSRPLADTVKDPDINHAVFAAAAARLTSVADREVIVVQVAHASQFGWTYGKHGISARIAQLMGAVIGQGDRISSGVQRGFAASPTPVANKAVDQKPSEARVTQTKPFSNPRLAELKSKWRSLGISDQFYQVHHFSDRRFSGKREPIDSFLKWCEGREIKQENAQTLDRALDVARRMKDGENFEAAVKAAWAAYPVVTR